MSQFFTIDENGERKCHFLDHQLAAARSKKKIAGNCREVVDVENLFF